eukprot:g63867.t1
MLHLASAFLVGQASADGAHHELFTESDLADYAKQAATIDSKLETLLGGPWMEVFCPNWEVGKLVDDAAAVAVEKKLQSTDVHVETVLDLLAEREDILDKVGPVKEHDCVLHAIITLGGPSSWVKTRSNLLWMSGHFYESTFMGLFKQLGDDVSYNEGRAIIQNQFMKYGLGELVDGFISWSLSWSSDFMRFPVSANMRAQELCSFCEIPEDYEGHIKNTELHHIPIGYTHTWLVNCVQKALPRFLEAGADPNAAVVGESILHEIGMLGNGAPLSSYGGKSITFALLDAGADPRYVDHTGYNMLHLTTFWANGPVMADLHAYKNGLYWQDLVNAKDLFGRTPRDLVCEAKWVENGLGETLMKLLGGPCPAGSVLHPATPEHICLGNEKERGMDASVCDPNSKTEVQKNGKSEEVHAQCELEVVDAAAEDFDMKYFLAHYMTLQRPVVVRNAFKPRKGSNLASIRKNLPNAKFTQVSVPYSNKFGRKTRRPTTIGKFLDTCMNPEMEKRQNASCSLDGKGYYQDYIFEVPDWQPKDNKAIYDIFVKNLPDFIDFSYDAKGKGSELGCPQFYAGPDRSGAQMHTHVMAHNMLYEGQKFWWFLAPLMSFTSNIHAIEWQDELAKQQGGLLTCTQYPGDFFFVPTHWGHGLVNEADSFGYACEIEWDDWFTRHVMPHALGMDRRTWLRERASELVNAARASNLNAAGDKLKQKQTA